MPQSSAKRSFVPDQHPTVHDSKKARGSDNGQIAREKYTVGWISALPLEMRAAWAMLDTIHDYCKTHPKDNNTYIFGSIAGHNCVLACLPAGVYGTTSATSVAHGISLSFPNIRYYFVVGVAGGAPTEHADIRLGDVVVSTPTARYSGVVQYDYGKTITNGEFEYTGKLKQPPSLLLRTISRIRAEHKGDIGARISKLVRDMLQRHPEMVEEYSHKGHDRDVLFQSEYEHPQGQSTCDNCDRQMIRTRPPRATENPTIHYGTIASGNQVIKHARTRDRLSSALGSLCFEMEAAGLMNGFPCLVIRGICDYSDSHKNKDWQGYAAATAAAFAKQLLSHTTAANAEPNVCQEDFLAKDARQCHSQQPLDRIYESLAFDQMYARYMTVQNAHHATCKWLFDHHRFKDWLNPQKMDEHHGFLWIKGKPAAGKSTIMKLILREFKKESTGTITLSYFFNARGEQLERSVLGMYRSLLYQLFGKFPNLRSMLNKVQPKTSVPETYRWTIGVLRNLFEEAVVRIEQHSLMCVIDALDECEENEIRYMLSSFERLGHLAASTKRQIRVCFSSRHYPHISMSHGINLILDYQEGHQRNVKSYIQTELKAGSGKTVEHIKEELLQQGSGIFLWVVSVVQTLNKEYDRGNIHALRERLSELPDSFHELLEDVLTREKEGENMEQTVLCLQWILFAKRPLKLAEAYFAIMSGLNADKQVLTEWDPEIVTPEVMHRFILNSSKGLVEITRSEVPTVQFIHKSIQDFLLKEQGLCRVSSYHGDFIGSSHDRLKRCCLSYISIDPVVRRSVTLSSSEYDYSEGLDRLSTPEVFTRFPFLEYAMSHMGDHANIAEELGFDQTDFRRAISLQNRKSH